MLLIDTMSKSKVILQILMCFKSFVAKITYKLGLGPGIVMDIFNVSFKPSLMKPLATMRALCTVS